MKNILHLLEPGEREHAISIMREWAQCPEKINPDACIKTLENCLYIPLGQWMERENDKTKGRTTEALLAAVNFHIAVADLIYSYRHKEYINLDLNLSAVEHTWKEFQEQAKWDKIAISYQAAKKGGSQPKILKGIEQFIIEFIEARIEIPERITTSNLEKEFSKYTEDRPWIHEDNDVEYKVFVDTGGKIQHEAKDLSTGHVKRHDRSFSTIKGKTYFQTIKKKYSY